MATPTLTQGTKEYLVVDLDDLTDELTDLTGTTPKFDVYTADHSAQKVNQSSATVDPISKMRLLCLVDTTSGGAWTTYPTKASFKLYVNFSTSPEAPRLGPFNFDVDPT